MRSTCSRSTTRGGDITIFFLLCVLTAGIYGAATASRKILYVQALPAALALAAQLLASRAR